MLLDELWHSDFVKVEPVMLQYEVAVRTDPQGAVAMSWHRAGQAPRSTLLAAALLLQAAALHEGTEG